MKIDRIYIEAFGGLKKFTLKLSEGFNTVYGQNENGKSTVMAFIKMMFYGSEQRQSSDLSKSTRRRYTPWDGSKMAGSIDFEHTGKRYRLEREFGASNSTDKLTLYDLDMGTRQSVAGNIGQEFFGISASAFERSVFVGQFGAEESDSAAEGEINAKLSNIAVTGDGDASYQTVFERLEDARFDLVSKSGKVGRLIKNRALLSELNSRLNNCEEQRKKRALTENEAKQLDSEIKELEKRYSELKKIIDSEQDIRNAHKLREMLSLKDELDNLNKTLKLSDGGLIDEMFVRKLEFCISKTDALEQKIAAKHSESETLKKSIELAEHPTAEITPQKSEELKNEISALNNSKETILSKIEEKEKLISEYENGSENSAVTRKSVNPLLLISSAVILLLTVCCFFVLKSIIYGSVSAVVCVLLFILSFTLNPSYKRKAAALENEKTLILEDIDSLKRQLSETEILCEQAVTRLNTIEAALSSNSSLISHQKSLLSECLSAISADTLARNEELEKLFELFGRYRNISSLDEIKSELDQIRAKAQEQKELKQRLNYIVKDLDNISYEDAEKRLSSMSESNCGETDFEKAHSDYDSVLAELTKKKTDLASLMTELKSLIKNAVDADDIKRQIDKTATKIRKQEDFYAAVGIAKDVLTESFAEIRRGFGSVLENKTSEIFKLLTGGRYPMVSISKSFDINVTPKDVFGSKEIAYLSSGTADQAYLSLRLALSDLICGDQSPLPVMLDDVLTQYDDARMTTAVNFLKDYSKNKQIILFTCHNSVFEASKTAGAEVTKL